MSRTTKQRPIRGEMIRTLQSIQIGTALALSGKRSRDDELDMHDIDLAYQLPISGVATSIIGWGQIEIEFEWQFHYAPANRDSRLVWPNFTYGAYIPSSLAEGSTIVPVGVLACVMDWMIDQDTNAIVGAVLAVGALGTGTAEDPASANPDTTEDSTPSAAQVGTPFQGQLHVNFQGWAMSRDDFSDTPDLETGADP